MGDKLQIKLLIISIGVLFYFDCFSQKLVRYDTVGFKKDFEQLLKKYRIQSKGYSVNVISINQKGGQNALVINNNFFSDSSLDSSNYNFKVIHEENQSYLIVSPKKGVWNSPVVFTDSLSATRSFFDPGVGFSSIIRDISVEIEGRHYKLIGKTKSSVCSKNFPLTINLSKDIGEFYIFGDIQDNRKLYLYKNGRVLWFPRPDED